MATVVRFRRHFRVYNPGEVAGFEDPRLVEELTKDRPNVGPIAEVVKSAEKKPEQKPTTAGK